MQELELTNFVLRGTKIIVVDGKARKLLEELSSAIGDKLDTSVFITTVEQIRNAIENKQNIITGGISTGVDSDYTGNRVLVTNSNGKLVVSSITTTLLNYLSGLTSNVQNQINNKIATTEFTTTFTAVRGGVSGNRPFLSYYWCVRGNTKHIEFDGQALATKILANSWTHVIDLPSEMIPTIQTYRTIVFGGVAQVIMQINTSGVVQFYCTQELVVGSTCYDGVEYI